MATEWLNFQAWVNGSMKSGTTFCPDLAGFDMYVPYSSLRAYWEHEKIMQVLHECTGPKDTRNIDQILESFIRIFSTLVYIHSAKGPTVHYITEFMSRNPSPITDNNLWLDPTGADARRVFGDLDNCPSSRATCDMFCENQYRFNHVLFRPGSGVNLGQLDRKMILPLQFDSSILSGKHGGTSVTVFKVQPGSGLGPEVRLSAYTRWVLFVQAKHADDTINSFALFPGYEDSGERLSQQYDCNAILLQ